MPIVGADLKGFVDQLLHKDPKYDGLEGIAVYNPAAIGAAGVKLALQVLNGVDPHDHDDQAHDARWRRARHQGGAAAERRRRIPTTRQKVCRSWQDIAIENLNVLWPVSWYINGWTDYTFDQMLECKGAGH